VANDLEFAMAAAVELREDFNAAALRKLARQSQDPGQIRRLLAVAEIYEGRSRGEAARVGGVGLQTLRDWVLRFNATGPAGLDGKAPGQPPKLNDEQRQQLLRIVETGPTPAIHGVVRWRLIDLAQWLFEEYGLSIAKQTLSREMRTLGLRKISARPQHHAQDPEQAEAYKKSSRPVWQKLPRQGRWTPR
jgi:transposase